MPLSNYPLVDYIYIYIFFNISLYSFLIKLSLKEFNSPLSIKMPY